jgi:drug/metabolite transporter (DMT)-like permease
MVILYVSATKATTAASAILLQYTAPIYIAMLGGWLLKEKAVLRDWIVILFVICGMVLFFLDKIGSGSLLGNLLAVFSGIAMAMNTIFMRREKDADPLENVFWGCVLTSVVTIPFMIRSIPDKNSWIGLILLGIFQLGLSYVLYAKAIKNISALQSTFLCLIEPLLNPLWVFLTIGEVPGRLSVLGGIVVLTSVTVGCIKPKKQQTQDLLPQQNSL